MDEGTCESHVPSSFSFHFLPSPLLLAAPISFSCPSLSSPVTPSTPFSSFSSLPSPLSLIAPIVPVACGPHCRSPLSLPPPPSAPSPLLFSPVACRPRQALPVIPSAPSFRSLRSPLLTHHLSPPSLIARHPYNPSPLSLPLLSSPCLSPLPLLSHSSPHPSPSSPSLLIAHYRCISTSSSSSSFFFFFSSLSSFLSLFFLPSIFLFLFFPLLQASTKTTLQETAELELQRRPLPSPLSPSPSPPPYLSPRSFPPSPTLVSPEDKLLSNHLKLSSFANK